ncbi:cytochrome bd oxidase small subunit CydS [Cytobacillus massiliigabonensis]
MSYFMIFYAPFIIVFLSITAAFWFVPKDDLIE